MNRENMLDALSEKGTWDVLVIGGGATGLGTALDALSRGYRTALLEASDFAKATSSRSTKLIHGGVRYLRSGQLRMVRESLHERERLLRNAPQLVHPLPFVIPSYRRTERWYYLAGLKAYDWLAGELSLEPARLLSKAEVAERLPNLQMRGLKGGVQYSDGQFDDARLALALARTCAERGAAVLNYAPVVRLMHDNGRLRGVVFRDEESGTEIQLHARTIVNATGVFSNDITRLDVASEADRVPSLVASQGTHIVLERSFLPSKHAVLIPETDDGRVLFAIPWYGKTLVGTTDREVRSIALEPKPLSDEVDYLLEHAGRYLCQAPQRSDIKSTFAGLRPLIGQSMRGNSTSRISREHALFVSSTGLLSIVGGKWTTYRQMGQDVVDQAAKLAGLPARPSATATLRLVGADSSEVDHSDPISVYREFQAEIDAGIQREPAWGRSIHPALPFLEAHVRISAQHEMARTVDDILARRTRCLILDALSAKESAPVVAEILADELGWDEARKQEQTEQFRSISESYRA